MSDISLYPIVKVSAHSNSNKVAGSIAKLLRCNPRIYVQAIGPLALVNALYALELAGRFVLEDKMYLVMAVSCIEAEPGDRLPKPKALFCYRFELFYFSNITVSLEEATTL
jgi:stage V sporulation protein S